MGVDHRVDQSEACCHLCCGQVREGGQQSSPEKDGSRRGDRQVKLLEQPEGKQRLHGETTGECVYAEQACEGIDDTAGFAQGDRLLVPP